jgi:2-polyprenyl-3-methyl-5-hydroxy-6-metoxy-1,4-benzoquinol methylase
LLGVMDALGVSRLIVRNRSNLDGFLSRIAMNRGSVETVQSYYDASVEQEWLRLERGYFEFEINKRYIDRYVKPGFRVLDVGGGPGRYSLHLASRGAEVTLYDLSNENIRFTKKKAAETGLHIGAVCGDARFLNENVEGMFDAILLMGPLYHLTGEADRARAVRACIQKLKPGGYLFAAFISILGGMIFAGRDAPESILWENEDVFYEKIIAREDFAGMAFTQAFFITPKNILPFMGQFPLRKLHLVASEGVCAPFSDRILAQPPEVRDKWLALSLALCEREEFFAMTEHFLYVGQKLSC